MPIGHPSIRQPFFPQVSVASRRFNMFRAGTDFTLAQCALACKQALTATRKRAYDDPSFHHEVTADSQAYEGMLEVIAVR